MEPKTIVSGTFKTPFGKLTILADKDQPATVIGAGFGATSDLLDRVEITRPSFLLANGNLSKVITSAVENWLDGNHQAFMKIEVAQIGTAFRQECWQAMRQIKPGQTISYSELAHQTSSPTAVRAAATACAQNLIAPLIPCHRIIKSDGSLGRYGYGELVKKQLLEFEGISL
jgi:methylated-DNA-[protein]-cysteine S-methyltransferase